MSKERIVFEDIELQEVEVCVHGHEYILRELTGKQATRWQNQQSSSVKLSAAGPVALKNVANLEPLLVQMSLYDAETNEQVPLKTIESWPFRIQRDLFKRAQTLSGLAKEARLSQDVVNAFKEEGAPCTIEQIRDWTEDLDINKYRAVKMLFSETDEEKAKNSQSGSTDGSD